MVIDSSVLLAIILGEADADLYGERILHAVTAKQGIYIPASVLVEAGIAAERRTCGERLDVLLEAIQPEIVSLDYVIADLARKAFRNFGRGRHPAKLNFGDCLSYATAHHLRLPLLFKGENFKLTDIRSALLSSQN